MCPLNPSGHIYNLSIDLLRLGFFREFLSCSEPPPLPNPFDFLFFLLIVTRLKWSLLGDL